MIRVLVPVLALAAACGDNVGVEADAPAVVTPKLEIGASHASIPIAFDATITGGAPAPLGNIAVTHDVGTFDVDAAPGAAFVYAVSQLAGYTLYQGFSVAPSRWDVFWLYCQGAQLASVYDEGVSGHPLFDLAATGSCAATQTGTTAAVDLPAFAIAEPAPRATGFTVTGASITVDATGAGSFTLAGAQLPLTVFDFVDCSTCGGAGWFELHSIVRDDAHGMVVYVIVYLLSGMPGMVELAYARSLPDLGDPIGTAFVPASWSGSARLEAAHPRLGMPPPIICSACK